MKKLIFAMLFLMCLFVVSEQKALASEGTTTDVEEVTTEIEGITTDMPLTSEVEPAYIPNENFYPGTNTLMAPGDVLYSSKSFATSTKIVGHVAIVGPDYKVYHSNPVGDVSGKSDTLTSYRNRHGANETIYVYRPHKGAPGAADWAKNNYHKAISYDIVNLSKLSTLNPNYCSKFIWQAFYFGAGFDVTNQLLTGDNRWWITPSDIKNSSNFFSLTSFSSR